MRLIDADLLGLTNMEIVMCDGDYKEALKMLIDKIDNAPAIEPERAHGHWIHRGGCLFECDQCGELVIVNAYTPEKASDRFKFCSSCGADMREGEQDG